MSRFVVGLCLLTSCQILAAPLSTSSYRIAWKQNHDTITLRLEDIDNAAISVDVPFRIVVQSSPGKELGEGGIWKDKVEIRLGKGGLIPPLLIRTIPLWPHEVTLSATVIPERGDSVSNQTTFTIQPPAWSAIVAAIFGGLAWGGISLLMKSGRKTAHVLGEFALSAVAGFVAWAAANVDAVWKLIGLNPDSFQLQTYFLLALCVAYLGVPRLLDRIMGKDGAETREPALTASAVEQRVVEVLNSDVIRKPVREELQEVLFAPDYLSQHSDLLQKVEQQVLTARYGGVSRELEDFLSPRTHELYTASHRENARTDLNFKRQGDDFLRDEKLEYTYVLNEKDTGEKLIRYAHDFDIPVRARGGNTLDLVRIGQIVQSFQLQLLYQDVDRIAYVLEDGDPGHLVLRLKSPENDDSVPREVPVACAHDQNDHTLSFKFSFPVPKRFLAKGRVGVFAQLTSLANANASVYFAQLSALTRTYTLNYSFSPPHRVEVVKYRWVRKNEDGGEEDSPGIARMPGWLVPGNGICLSWYPRDGRELDRDL